MTRARVAAVLFGVAFGFLISWGTLTDPDTIRAMLLFEEAYVFLMMGGAVAVGFVGVKLLTRRPHRALLTGDPVQVRTDPIARRHIVGSATFGLGGPSPTPARGRSPHSWARRCRGRYAPRRASPAGCSSSTPAGARRRP